MTPSTWTVLAEGAVTCPLNDQFLGVLEMFALVCVLQPLRDRFRSEPVCKWSLVSFGKLFSTNSVPGTAIGTTSNNNTYNNIRYVY